MTDHDTTPGAPETETLMKLLAEHEAVKARSGWYCRCDIPHANGLSIEVHRLHLAAILATEAATRDAAQRAEALLPIRRFAEASALTARATGRADEERQWLDLLILVERDSQC